MRVTTTQVVAFHKVLTDYYYQSGRHDMLWRQPDTHGRFDPYKIMLSELMLQQTQVDRVTPKYAAFLEVFPDVRTLAVAEMGDVLRAWNGLGYNRRAKYIWQAARMVVDDYDGEFPETLEELRRLPGIGPNTAGAIVAYAYDQPVLFIETNVRTVLIYHFFKDSPSVADTDVLEVLKAVAPHPNFDKRAVQGAALGPRQFYYAVMDYGTFLKKTVGNLSRSSKHYAKQTKFDGSKRQLRGRVIKMLTAGQQSLSALRKQLADERLDDVLHGLAQEEMIARHGNTFRLR